MAQRTRRDDFLRGSKERGRAKHGEATAAQRRVLDARPVTPPPLSPSRKIDVDLARARTPGLANITHLNNAGAALMSERVLNTAIEHLRLEAVVGGY